MRWAKFFFSLLFTLGLMAVLWFPLGSIPFALGEFLNPFQGFWQNAVPTAPERPQTLDLPGLEAPVEVVFDERQVPHIFAQNEHDLFLAQGYLHAQDRLWQMEFQTHAAAGRLSELFGPGPDSVLITFDRRNRRKGMVFAARRSLQAAMAHPRSQTAITAYAEGVNAYIESLSPEQYPIEYKILGYAPERWQPLKTAFLLKYMANTLCGSADDLAYTRALATWGEETFRTLYPTYPEAQSPIVPASVKWPKPDLPPPSAPPAYAPDSLLAPDLIPRRNPGIGSNNWAVAPQKAEGNAPLLANDPHLGLNLPSLWYENQLVCPEFNAYGVSFPGSPAVIIGFNDSVAFGATNGSQDVMDFYQIEFRDETKEEYRYEGDWLGTRLQIDTIRIKGGGVFYDSVYYTHHGPVMYDETFGEQSVPLAVRWVAHDPANELLTFLNFDRADNYEDYLEALQTYGSPAQNFIFASAAGDIALWQQGKNPNRWPDMGRFVLDGSRQDHEWQSFIPQPFNPHVVNPEQGFIGTANQHPLDPATYPYHIYGSYDFFRGRRLHQLLRDEQEVSVSDMQRFQLDTYGMLAADMLPLMLSELDSAALRSTAKQAFELLRRWDFHYDRIQAAPTIFDLWWRNLYRGIWQDEFAGQEGLETPTYATTIGLLQDSAEMRFYARGGRALNRRQLVQEAFEQTIDSLKIDDPNPLNWIWGEAKKTSFLHLVPTLAPFHKRNLSTDGDRNSLNATSPRWGPSWRMVVKLGAEPEAIGIYPGGQSGNPGSPFYDHTIEDWAEGRYYPLWFMRDPSDSRYPVTAKQQFQSPPPPDPEP